MSHDGRTRLPAALTGVTILKARFVVWKLKFNATIAHGYRGILTLLQECEVAQIPIIVWASNVISKFLSMTNLEDSKQEVAGSVTKLADMFRPASSIVVALVLATAGTQNG
ncbi:MAG: hypothetical protein A3F75_10970 [Betaproteobacteria bacterium RIFCSPLOWO2_12_FULL_64_23]|nr:MAG: hypothetical protein A3F75_10970 [Betaproteobacteria bacterium RIFCSPLOWO2_12_FULL_64_23]